MEGRNFHTALLGGFRKKDVIRYLAEEKRLQEEQLEDLRRGQTELERQLDEAHSDSDSERKRSEELQNEAEALRQQLEMALADLNTAREAQLLTENRLAQAKEERLALEGRLDAEIQKNRSLREELEAQKACGVRLEEQLNQARLQERYGLELPSDRQEGESLRADLAAERQRVVRLEEQLRQLAAQKGETGSADQLWALCGKMERTIRQMEQLLDGPYRLTCYPEPMERPESCAEVPEQEPCAEAQPESSAPEPPTVKSLLQRIRIKR